MNTNLKTQQLLNIIKSGTWFVQGFNGLPLYLHGVASTTGWMLETDFGQNYSHFFLRVNESRAHWYYDELDMHAIGTGYYKRVTSPAKLNSLIAKHKATYLKAKKASGTHTEAQLKKMSLAELVALIQKMANELKMSVGIAHAQEGISFVSEARLIEMLELRKANTAENHQLLSSPLKLSYLSEAQILLGRIKHTKGSRKEKFIQQFIKNFSFIDNSYVKGVKLSEKDVNEKIKHLKHIPKLSQLNMAKIKKTVLIKKLRLNSSEKFVITTVEMCTKWQDDRKKYIMQTIGRYEPVVEEISQRLNIKPEIFKYLIPSELTAKNLTSASFLTKLKKRWPGCAYYTHHNRIDAYPGQAYALLEKELSKTETKGITELKGGIANKGFAKGVVRIIRTIHDIPKVKKGEIIIAYMTRPEFMPAMQKAAAFVTNEGGITSHAAIVSRELNKPCIIGTKIATEVFQDGDIVEVDANKGTVRKI